MDEKSDVREVLRLMEWYQGLREDYDREAERKIEDLAAKVGVTRSPGESVQSLIARVRRLRDSGFPPEEPETAVSGTRKKTVPPGE
jgi:hypothetical protein